LLLFAAALAAQSPASNPAPAGSVTDLIPRVTLTRASAKLNLQVQDPLFLEDMLQTEKKSRARLRLLDGSLVNLGPKSRFAILEMDAVTQQSFLVLGLGQLRAEVTRRTQPNGYFVVRTQTTVLGVMGTIEFVAAFLEETIVANLSDDPNSLLWVRSSDPAIDVVVFVKPGFGTRVPRGSAPTPPRPWDEKEIARTWHDSRPFGRYDANFSRDYPDGFPYPADAYRNPTYPGFGDDYDPRGANSGSGSSNRGSGSSGGNRSGSNRGPGS
jgi:ferric-dicitrate binding protein FerR (iron transport regulator)